MARQRPSGDIFTAFEGTEPAYAAEPIDEYRDLAMLADAWERVSLSPEVAEDAPAQADDAEGQESVLR